MNFKSWFRLACTFLIVLPRWDEPSSAWASPCHQGCHHLLAAGEEVGLPVEWLKKASAGNPDSFYSSEQIVDVTDAADCVGASFVAGTAWLFSRPEFDGALDASIGAIFEASKT